MALLSFSKGNSKVKKTPLPRTTGDPMAINPTLPGAEQQAREILLEAKDEALRIKQQADEEAKKTRAESFAIEQRLVAKEDSLDKKATALDEREKGLAAKQQELQNKITELEKVKDEQLAKLERVAGLSVEEAKQKILAGVEEKIRVEAAKLISAVMNQAKEEAAEKAREILVSEMVHGATDYVPEFTVSTIKLPDDEVKGKIIGKEGRNIRAIEQSTGVDLELDEENQIRLSSYDGIRREIARVSLQRLIADGRIQPSRIEEIVAQVRRDIDRIIHDEGVKLAQSVGVYNLPREIIDLLGRFKYRFSYGQNMIAHTLEETKLGVAIASEVGADVNVVRLGCLLHDIGKVIDNEEGSHVTLAVSLLKKFGFPQKVIDCVAQHHEDEPFTSVESMIVYIADAISGARPGARYEDLEKYIQRLSELEEICKGFTGVVNAWVFQAGREIRVLVNPEEISDADAIVLAEKIREKIEEQIKDFPGQIRVTVIREFRVVQTTK